MNTEVIAREQSVIHAPEEHPVGARQLLAERHATEPCYLISGINDGE
jgi:hypothetical protein